MRHNFIHAILILALLSACKKQENIVRLEQDLPSVSLPGRQMDIPGILSPSRIYIKDSLLLFKDNQSKGCQMFVHDLRSGQTTQHVRLGRGPGEMLGAFYFGIVEDGGTYVAVHDITTGRILMCKLDSLREETYAPKRMFDQPTLSRKASCITGYGKDLLGIGIFDDARVVKISEGDSIRVLAAYSPDTKGDMNIEQARMSYGGVIKSCEARKKCVIACRYADQLEIVDLVSGSPIFVKGPAFFEPMTKILKGKGGIISVSHDKDERKGYIDVCCDEKYIYALYSGKETREKKSSWGHILRVFDWKGNYLHNYDLREELIAVDVSEDGRFLYGISEADTVFRYELTVGD